MLDKITRYTIAAERDDFAVGYLACVSALFFSSLTFSIL